MKGRKDLLSHFLSSLWSVLVWTGIELIFFTASSVRWQFGFVLEVAQILPQEYFHIAEQPFYRAKTFSAPQPIPQMRTLGMHKELGESQWDSWPWLAKGTSYTIWHHAQHVSLGEEGRGRHVWSNGICLPKSWSLVFLGMAEHLPAHRKWGMNSFSNFNLHYQY